MKKLISTLFITFAVIANAQYGSDYYPVSTDYGDYYSDNDDAFYFPDDYYYQYPDNYYTPELYADYYQDYQRSITSINWNRFFVENRLSPWQIQQIVYLNSMYANFDQFNHYYRYNPNRWYYDRFYALQQILGPSVFVVYQQIYLGGYHPFVYYRDYCSIHYRPTVFVTPRYRNININIYKIDRYQYHQNYPTYNPRNSNSFKDTPRSGNTNWNNGKRSSNTFRNDGSDINTNNNVRNNPKSSTRIAPRENTNPTRINNGSSPQRINSGKTIERKSPSPSRNTGQRFVKR